MNVEFYLILIFNKGWSQVYKATQMTNFITLSSAYKNNLGLAIRNELKIYLYIIF